MFLFSGKISIDLLNEHNMYPLFSFLVKNRKTNNKSESEPSEHWMNEHSFFLFSWSLSCFLLNSRFFLESHMTLKSKWYFLGCFANIYFVSKKYTWTNSKIIVLPTVNTNGEKCRMNFFVWWFFWFVPFPFCVLVTQVFFEATRKNRKELPKILEKPSFFLPACSKEKGIGEEDNDTKYKTEKRNDACIQNEWMLHMASFKEKKWTYFLHAKRKIKRKQ